MPHRLTALALLIAAPALAQDAAKPATPPAPTPTPAPSTPDQPVQAPLVVDKLESPSVYQIKVQPRIWYVAPSGDLVLPGSPANTPSVSLDTLNLDSPRISPYGDAIIRFDRWSVNLAAMSVSADRSTTAQFAGQIGGYSFNPGDPIRSSFDLIMGETSVGYSLGTWKVTQLDRGGYGLIADLSVLGGVRMYDVDIGVGATSPDTTKVDEFFIEPILGARLELDFARDFSIDIQSSFGYLPGDRDSNSWDIQLAFSWRPVENLGLQVGYRNIFLNLENGDGADRFDFEGGMAGLFAGLQIRF